ncbi:MAG: SpoIIE family protein phosphatase [Flavobacteriales bacterium]|nr:SpoIIE family protein phosphatase [Flavobacteriales bacterium]
MRSSLALLFSFLIFSSYTLFAQTINDRIEYAGKIYYANPDSSFIICNEIESDAKTENHLAEAYLCQARYLVLKTKFDKATDLLNKASAIFKKENNLSRLAKCHSLQNILFGRISDQKKALFHSKKALELYTAANDTLGQISILTNISLDFLRLQKNDTAFIYLIKLKHLSKNKKESSKYYMHQNFATYFYNIGDFNASINSYNKALIIAEKSNMIDSKSTVLMLMSNPYIAQKKYKKAEENLNKSLTIAINNNLLYESNETYKKLIKLNELLGNYKKAYQLEKLNDVIEKEIYNLDKINKINEIESQLKLTEKEKIITQKELELKNEQFNTIEAKSKITQLFFVVAISLLIIISIVIILFRVKKLNRRIQSQKMMLEQKNTEITDSINYAKRIQAAILPDMSLFKKSLPNSFILYKPKDIVAGDFYWMKSVGPTNKHDNSTVLYAAADCTGHGVPGAMVSVVCSNALNQSVKELQTNNPAEILDFTRILVKENLKSEDENVKDGMDIALCFINFKTMEINFSGANNPLYIIRNNELIEIKGDKQPVGKYFKEKTFNNHSYQLQKKDMVYTFTDGYADQFGGPKGKKFMYRQFKQLLTNIATKPIETQHEILNQTFENWRGDLEQIDDICIIGVRI